MVIREFESYAKIASYEAKVKPKEQKLLKVRNGVSGGLFKIGENTWYISKEKTLQQKLPMATLILYGHYF